MSEINIRALARELNLSISTVSKALKDSYEISPETKARVVALAKALNYTPNPYASSLRRRKSNTIAVVVPDVADSFFSVAIKGIEEVAQARGYHVLLYLTHEQVENEIRILGECTNGRVDGVMMSVTSETTNTAHIQHLYSNSDHPVPLVFFDRAIEELQVAKVTTNDFESCVEATQHLVDNGCTNIAYLSISSNLGINNKRIAGFKSALQNNGQTFNDWQVVTCSNDALQNEEVIYHLFKRRNKPDGVIAGVEKLITPIYEVCARLKILIPQHLKVISFSNLPYAPILSPSLTTITQPALQMGQTAANVLFKAIEKRNHQSDENIVVPSVLIKRNSTAHDRSIISG